MTEAALPPGIGPHEGRECKLMLAGRKPLAMFCDAATSAGYFPEEEFAPHVLAGSIIRREEFYRSADGKVITRCLFFALPSQEWRIEEAHLIQEAIFSGRRCATEADDVRLGSLLGYAEDEIASFLDHVRPYRTCS